LSNDIYYRPLSIPFDIKHPEFGAPIRDQAMANRKYDVIDTRLLDFIDSCGVYPVYNEYFVFAPEGSMKIHVDEPTLTSVGKLVIFLGSTGKLKWFDPIPEAKGKGIRVFSQEKVTLAYESEMMGEYIINVGIPHTFVNDSDSLCYIVGFLLFDKHTNTFLSFEDGVERFSKYARQPVAQKTTSDNIIQNTFDKSKEIE
jgi:hypothetical protein